MITASVLFNLYEAEATENAMLQAKISLNVSTFYGQPEPETSGLRKKLRVGLTGLFRLANPKRKL